MNKTECCPRQFIQLSSNGNVKTCLSCKYKTKTIREYECPLCHHKYIGSRCDLGDDHSICYTGCQGKFKRDELIVNYREIICTPNDSK